MQIDHVRSRPTLTWFWKGFLKDFVYKVTRSSPDKLAIDFERGSLSFFAANACAYLGKDCSNSESRVANS